MGELKIKGVIRLNQFWPKGKSEVKASTLKITVDSTSFSFQNSENQSSDCLSAFQNGYVVLKRKKQKIIKRGNQVTICLQGIDAPELCYTLQGTTPTTHPTTNKRLDDMDYQHLIYEVNKTAYRQPFAETASLHLLTFLSKVATKGQLNCEVICHVQQPQDACDMYGRIVGSVYITIDGEPLHLNQWLLANSLAFPLFYNTMPKQMISEFYEIARQAKKESKKIYKHCKHYLGMFDQQSQYRWPLKLQEVKKTTKQEAGHLIHPKIYRQWCVYNIYKMAGIIVGTFSNFLESVDEIYTPLPDFLEDNIQQQPLRTLVQHNRLLLDFGEVVFEKRPVQLLYDTNE